MKKFIYFLLLTSIISFTVVFAGCSNYTEFKVASCNLPYSDESIQNWIDKNHEGGGYIGKTVDARGKTTLYLYVNSSNPINKGYKKYSEISIGSGKDKKTIEINTKASESSESKEKQDKLFRIMIENSAVDAVIINGEKIKNNEIQTIKWWDQAKLNLKTIFLLDLMLFCLLYHYIL